MNLLQAKTHLEKIITLYKTISGDPANVSAIERDLMKSYIKQLYESFLDDISAPPVKRQDFSSQRLAQEEPKPQPVAAPPAPEPAPVVAEKPKYVPPAPPTPEPVERFAYTPPKVDPEYPKYMPPPVVKETPPPAAPKAPEPPRAAPVWNQNTDVDSLFEASATGSDLSDRISHAPIPDLTKAFALNDKLLFINELFGGDATTLDHAVKYVNTLASFDSAKLYLKEFAVRFNWAGSDSKKRQALAFIKLVRRRFK